MNSNFKVRRNNNENRDKYSQIDAERHIGSNSTRINYFDILRIISSFAIIIIHTSGRYNSLNFNTYNYKIAFYYNGASRFGVPIFFLISGALFLSKDISFEKIFKKYILRILNHLIAWSFIYSINKSKKDFKNNFFLGHYHFWYLNSTMQLYTIVPFLRKIVKKENLLISIIRLTFLFTFLIPYLVVFKSFCNKYSSEILNALYLKFNNNYLKGYIFYFIFGYYLSVTNFGFLKRIIIYFLGLIGFSFTLIFYLVSVKYQYKMMPFFFRALNLNILAYSTAIFIFFKYNFNNIGIYKMKFIKLISNHTFGIYLIHPMILKLIRGNKDRFLSSLNLLFKIPLMSLFIFHFSFLICFFLKYLPFIGNYLV